jgi:hypothetical protein
MVAAIEVPAMPEIADPRTTHSINHEATQDLDSTNAFEGMFWRFCSQEESPAKIPQRS